MLLIVTAQIMGKAAGGDGSIALKYGSPGALFGRQRGKKFYRFLAPCVKCGKHLSGVRMRVIPVNSQLITVERVENRSRFLQDSTEPHVITVDLDISHMADLTNGTE